MAVNIGPKIGVDGEAEYRKQLNNIIQQAKTLSSEMKAVTSAFDANDKSQEKVSAQSNVLTKQIEVQKQRIDQLTKGLNEATKEFGTADTRTQKWQQAVNEATTDLNRMQRELKDLDNSVDDVSDSMKEAEKSTSSFGDVLKAGAIIEGVKSIASSIKDIAESVVEYRKIMGTLEVSSQKAGYTASETEETYKSLYGVLGDEQTAATTTANLQALGLAQLDLQEVINGTIGAWSLYGDSIPIDSLAESINETMRSGQVTGTFADVLNWGSKEGEKFGVTLKDNTEENKKWNESVMSAVTAEDFFNLALEDAENQAERVNLVVQALANQGLTDLGQAWKDNNADIVEANYATESLNQAYSRLSEMVLPIITTIKQTVADLLNGFLDLVEQQSPIIGVIIGVATAFTVLAVAMNIVSLINTVKNAMFGLFAAMAANPFVFIAAAIAGLVAGIAYFVSTNEEAQEALKGAWESITNAVSSAIETIKSVLNTVIEFVKNNWQGLLLFLVNPLLGAFKIVYDNCEDFRETINNLVKNIKEGFERMKEGIATTVGNIRDAIVNGIQKAVDFITSLPKKALQWGKDFIQGLINGIKSMISKVTDAVKGVADKIKSFLHFSKPDEGPLREYETWMPDMIDGMVKSLNASSYKLENAVGNMVLNMVPNLTIPTTGMSGGNTFSITVNAAQGQSEEAIAELVMNKLQHEVRQREVVFG